MRRLFHRLYFVYALSLIVLTFLLLYPFFLLAILLGKNDRIFLATNWVWCLLFFNLTGLRTKVSGRIPQSERPFVIIANHASYLDIPVLTDVLTFPHAFVGKESLNKVPLFGYMYRSFHILLDRNDRRDRAASLKKAEAALRRGKSVIIFPEGKIDATFQPKLGAFYDGAFILSKKMNLPILPIALANNWRILPDDNSFLARPERSQVVVLPLMYPADFITPDEMKSAAHALISKAYLPQAATRHGDQ